MPKLAPNEREIARRTVQSCMDSNMTYYRLDKESLAKKIGRSERTVRNKYNRPETFTLGELQIIAKAIKITPLQAASIVMGRPITNKDFKDIML